MKDLTLKIRGSITIGEGDILIHKQVRDALAKGCKVIIIDMEHVTYMDSSAVGELAACFSSVKNKGGQLGLTKLPRRIRKLLKIMAFTEIFPIFSSNEEALKALHAKVAEMESED